jgi:hypothetical protein
MGSVIVSHRTMMMAAFALSRLMQLFPGVDIAVTT